MSRLIISMYIREPKISRGSYINTMPPGGIIHAVSGHPSTIIYILRNTITGRVHVGQTQEQDLRSVLYMHKKYYQSVAEHGPLIPSCYLFLETDDLESIECLYMESVPAGEHQRLRDRVRFWKLHFKERGLLVETLITTRAWSRIGETSESGSSSGPASHS